MDHLELPRNPIHGPVQVKFFCTEAYEAECFASYFQEKGWTWEDLIGLDIDRTEDERNCLVQTWLYFGLMSEIFGQKVDMTSFISTEYTAAKIITSVELPILTTQWTKAVASLSEDAATAQRNHAWACLAIASKFFHDANAHRAGVVARDGPGVDVNFIDDLLALSCEILHQHLHAAVQSAYEPAMLPDIAASLDQLRISLPHDNRPGLALGHSWVSLYLKKSMIRDGWCATEIERLFWYLLPAERYFVSLLKRPNLNMDHGDCSDRYCAHWRVEPGTYVTKHVSASCMCQAVCLPQDRSQEILASGKIPLITSHVLEHEKGSEPLVVLTPSGPGVRYTAISHVWADGLGNPNANEIPKCQFVRLSNMVETAEGNKNALFWLDTLCFPLTPKDAYDNALKGMRRTYEEADLVLVLDSYLLDNEVDVLGNKEMRLRILCSRWSCRLWTYQENRLARRLLFQFKDRQVEVPFGLLDNMDHHYSSESSGTNRYQRLWLDPTTRERSKSQHICEARYNIAFRATSVAADEALCLANLIGMDANLVVDVPAHQRMAAFWRAIDPKQCLPALFWNCARLDQDGLRWAPATLMTRTFESMTQVYNTGTRQVLHNNPLRLEVTLGPLVTLVSEGLCVTFPGIILSGIKRPVESEFFYEVNGQWFQVDAIMDIAGELVKGSLMPSPNDNEWPLPVHLALVFSEQFDDDFAFRRPMEDAVLCSVAQVSMGESLPSPVHIKLLCTVHVTRIDRPEVVEAFQPLEEIWDSHIAQEKAEQRETSIRFESFPPWGWLNDSEDDVVMLNFGEDLAVPYGRADPEEDRSFLVIPPQRVLIAEYQPCTVWCFN